MEIREKRDRGVHDCNTLLLPNKRYSQPLKMLHMMGHGPARKYNG
jgi:hypothetical protein